MARMLGLEVCTLLVPFFLLKLTNCYGTQITMSSGSTASITNFYQDLAYCPCDLSPGLCDNYCCCDGSCSLSRVTTWTASSSCLPSSNQIESLCNQSSTVGFGSFNDLSCVYFSNRGTIGYFYAYPVTTSITYLQASKFASLVSTSTLNAKFTAAATTVTLDADYGASNPYLQSAAAAFFIVPKPGPAGTCVTGVINVTYASTPTTTTTTSSACKVTATSTNCVSLNLPYSSTFCLVGNCSTSSSGAALSTPSFSGSTCSNVLSGLSIVYTISSILSAYSLSSASVTASYSSLTVGVPSIITVTQTVTAPAATSGKPGYQLGKAITVGGSGLSGIADPTSGVCYLTAAATGSISVLLGQAASYRCESVGTTPCSTENYIDALLGQTIIIQQYASQSTTTITVGGTGGTSNCFYETYTMEIVYSYDGWELDPQYYVVGAKLIPSFSAEGGVPSSKYLQIKWVYVDPKTVNTPPSNLFNSYFSYLWTPLKQQFGIN